MPTRVTEGSLRFTVEMLEALPSTAASYPSPALGRTGNREQREFRTLLLSNSFLELTLLPDLGGRIIRIRDKRTQLDLIPFHEELKLLNGGPRGIYCDSGLQVLSGREDRLHSMGTVMSSLDFSEDDDEPSAIRWAELGYGISLNVRVSMPSDAAQFDVEVRAFNRTESPLHYNGGLRAGGWIGRWVVGTHGPVFLAGGSGIAVQASSPFDGYGEEDAAFALHRFNHLRSLAPHQLDAWTLRFTPYSGLQEAKFVGPRIGFGWTRSEFCIATPERLAGAKVVIQTEVGQVLEATMELSPESPEVMDLSQLKGPIVAAAVLTPDRVELGKVDGLLAPVEMETLPDEVIETDQGGSEEELARLTFDVGKRHIAHWKLALRHLSRGDFQAASSSLEQSLLFNGEDHLAWWLKALCERLSGNSNDESNEILNAHFLAPLDPVLRAESYLARPSQTQDKSPLLNPLEEMPESFVDVSCLLLDAELWEEATKWIDEGLRHIQLPMLHYLQAYAFLQASRMEVQAASHVQSATILHAKPPYPWRAVEKQALAILSSKFPEDKVLQEFARMASRP